jgi:hypothetical protein
LLTMRSVFTFSRGEKVKSASPSLDRRRQC